MQGRNTAGIEVVEYIAKETVPGKLTIFFEDNLHTVVFLFVCLFVCLFVFLLFFGCAM